LWCPAPVWPARRGTLYALDHHVEQLAVDHAHARMLAGIDGVDIEPTHVETNIVNFEIDDAAGYEATFATHRALVGAKRYRRVRALNSRPKDVVSNTITPAQQVDTTPDSGDVAAVRELEATPRGRCTCKAAASWSAGRSSTNSSTRSHPHLLSGRRPGRGLFSTPIRLRYWRCSTRDPPRTT
jgi:hypothetical protein